MSANHFGNHTDAHRVGSLQQVQHLQPFFQLRIALLLDEGFQCRCRFSNLNPRHPCHCHCPQHSSLQYAICRFLFSIWYTLHAQDKTNIKTAAEAAEALRPVAGNFAFFLFATGIVGTGLLAIPVLAGSAAYAVGEALKWPIGLERKPLEARGFYLILSTATLIGLAINFTPIDSMQALFWAAVVNGTVAPRANAS